MKIALAVDSFPSRSGVAESWPSQIAERLLRRNHEVHVLACEFTAPAPPALVAHRAGRGRSTRRDALVEASLRTLNVDVVHNLGLGRYADVFTPLGEPDEGLDATGGAAGLRFAGLLKRLAGRLVPTRRAGSLEQRPRFHPRTRIAAPSAMAAAEHGSFHGISPDRLHVVYPGVDIKRFSPHIRALRRDATRRELGVTRQELLVLWIGQDWRRKGLDTALRAVKRVAAGRGGIRLVALGGVDRHASEKLAGRLGAADRTAFLGHANPIPYYAAADALVLPSRHDAFSLTLLEAAACGLPSIASRRDGASELFSDGVEGYLLASGDDDSQLAARLVDLLDPARRERMGRAARRMAIAHTLDRSVDQLLQLYQAVVSERLLSAAGRDPAALSGPAGQELAARSRRAA